MDQQTFKAIQDSIAHWKQDIIEPLKSGMSICIGSTIDAPRRHWDDELKTSVKMYGMDCPLCIKFKLLDNMTSCKDCPLHLANKYCEEFDSPWLQFFLEPTLENAEAMVAALEELIKPSCPQCSSKEITTTKEGCYGSYVHNICQACHHEFDTTEEV